MTVRARVFVAIAIAIAATSGCSTTVEGVAVRAANATPKDVRPLRELQLDAVMLSIEELNRIVGATEMGIVVDSRKMSDSAEAVSDPDCVGSIFGAEDLAYRDSGFTAVRDQVAREPGDGNEHWIEQAVVLYPTEEQATGFASAATSSWRECGGFSVVVDDELTSSIWLIADVDVREDVVTQVVAQEDSEGWECQHAMSAVANVSIEVLACAFGIHDEAVETVNALVANAARQ